MKNVTLIMLASLISLFLLIGCSTATNDIETETDVTGPPPEAVEFTSLDRLLSAQMSGALAHIGIDSSAELYLPSTIPEGYEPYSILASNGSISISFLPEEHTETQWSIFEAQNDNKHFAFWYALPSEETPNTVAGLLEQFDADESDLIAGKYLFSRPTGFFWVEDETMFSISLPITMITPFASALRDENVDGIAIMDHEGFSDLLNFLKVEVMSN